MLFLKFLFVGPPRLGKTTVRRRLLKEIIDLMSAGEVDQSHPSTGTVESSDVVVTGVSSTTAVITESEWSELAGLIDETRMLVQSLLTTIQLNTQGISKWSLNDDITTPDSSVGINSSTHIMSSHLSPPPAGASQYQSSFQPVSSDTFPEHQKSQVPQHIVNTSQILREAMGSEHWKCVKKHMFKAYLRMEDTGGQPELMDMLPALTFGPGLYLLFINLQNDLDHHYKLSYCNSCGVNSPSLESIYSVKDMLLASLSSISCSNASVSNLGTSSSHMQKLHLESSKSVAYIVGTHKDLASNDQIKKLNDELKKVIVPTQFYKQDIVQFASEEDLIVTMDNMAGGAEEVLKVRKLLEDTLARHFKKLRIPAVWLFFSLFLRHHSNSKTASFDYCMQLSGTLGMSAHETEVALWFLHHHAGVLMYFPNVPELKDLVITDVQIVYDSVTSLILQAMSFDKVGHSDASEFKKTGIFTKSRIVAATSEVSGEYIPADKLLVLLQFLHIIVEVSNKGEVAYMMPCVLRNATIKELNSMASEPQVIPPILFHFKCGSVPIGIFPSLMACLISSSSFMVIQELMYKNMVRFYFGEFYTSIDLVCHQTYYECIVSKISSTNVKPHIECALIRKQLEAALSTVSSCVNYGSFMDYEFAFDCPLHPANDREHLCVVDRTKTSSGMMLCLSDSGCPVAVEIPAEAKVWFSEVRKGKLATFMFLEFFCFAFQIEASQSLAISTVTPIHSSSLLLSKYSTKPLA